MIKLVSNSSTVFCVVFILKLRHNVCSYLVPFITVCTLKLFHVIGLVFYADKAKRKKKDSVNIRFTFNNDAADGNVEALSETKKTFTQGKLCS